MMSNETLLQKADLALSDLASGGLLQSAQAAKFMRILIDETAIMKEATVVPMAAQKQLIEKIRFGSRVLKAGTTGAALASGDRSKPDLSKVELDAKLIKAEVRIPTEVLEDNIERKGLQQTVMTLLAERAGLDLEELVVRGDTTSGDAFLALLNGMIKAATTNVVDFLGNTLSQAAFNDALRAMPSEFQRDRKSLRFWTSVKAELDYRNSLAERMTAVGDRILNEANTPQTPFGVTLRDVPVFPENLGAGTDETVLILTDPKNVQVGIWRKMTLEWDKDISAGVLIVVLTLRADFKYAEETAVVKVTKVKVA